MALNGMSTVMRNLKKVAHDLDGGVAVKAGLHEARIIILRRAKARTPVDTGNLINSYSLPPIRQEGSGWVADIVNTATYAVEVHEAVGRAYRRPGSGPKFLETAMFESQKDVQTILRRWAKQGVGR